MKEKLMELCKNKEFTEKLNSLKTEAEVIDFLKSNGIEVNSLDELKSLMQSESEELDVNELNQASGGGFICILVGLGAGVQWCDQKGHGEFHPYGAGGAACVLIGAGIGFGTNEG